MAKVFILKAGNIQKSVGEALNLFLDDLPTLPKNVLIKPNFLNSSPASEGVTTDLRIISALIAALKEKGVEHIIIGESAGMDSITKDIFKDLSIYQFQDSVVDVVNFEECELIEVSSPCSLKLKKFHIPKVMQECDLIISAAKMKTHVKTRVTLNIKNFFGCIPKYERRRAHKIGLDESLIDIYSYFAANKKILSFVDGIYALDGFFGPSVGDPIKLDLIVAGDDPVSTDIICCELMSVNPKSVKQLSLCKKYKIGDRNIEVFGEKINNVKRKFHVLHRPLIYILSIVDKLCAERPFLENEKKCINCKDKKCLISCPENAITPMPNGEIKFDYHKCTCNGFKLACSSCLTACELSAIGRKTPFPGNIIHQILIFLKEKIGGK